MHQNESKRRKSLKKWAEKITQRYIGLYIGRPYNWAACVHN